MLDQPVGCLLLEHLVVLVKHPAGRVDHADVVVAVAAVHRARAALERPQQVGVLVGTRVDGPALGRDHLCPDEVVAGEAVPPREVSDAAAQRQAGDEVLGDVHEQDDDGDADHDGRGRQVGPLRGELRLVAGHAQRPGQERLVAADDTVLAAGEAIGVVETTSVSSGIDAADAAVKAADVALSALRLADGIGGKAYLVVEGTVSASDSSRNRANAA